MSALDAVRARQSCSKVTDTAPSRDELLPLIAAAGRVADHSSLRPWRIIEVRGADREALGEAIAAAQGAAEPSTKPLRAPLLLAVVASYRPSEKVPHWEQEAVASGVAHMLSLLLDEAGWGVIWRTGAYTRSDAVAAVHGLRANEALLGWLYVGGKPPGGPGHRKSVDASAMITRMPSGSASGTVGGGSAERSPDDAQRHPAEQSSRKAAKKAAKKAKKAAEKARRAARTPQEKHAERRRALEKASIAHRRKADKHLRKARKAERAARQLGEEPHVASLPPHD